MIEAASITSGAWDQHAESTPNGRANITRPLLGGLTYAAMHLVEGWSNFATPRDTALSLLFVVLGYLGPGMFQSFRYLADRKRLGSCLGLSRLRAARDCRHAAHREDAGNRLSRARLPGARHSQAVDAERATPSRRRCRIVGSQAGILKRAGRR